MKILAVLVAFTALLLAAVAAFAPAALLDARVNAETQGRLRVADTAGTVWDGRGVLTNEQRTWSFPARWKIDPVAILRGNASLKLQAAEGGDLPRGVVAWQDATLTLDGIALTLPATALDETPTAGNAIAFGGDVTFDSPHLRWDGKEGDGAATARWSGARLAGNAGTLALGTVSMNFVPRAGRIQGRIENRGGDVLVDGDLAFGSAGFDISATLAPLPSTPPAVLNVLRGLGTPDAGGAVRVQWHSGNR
jgi:hypothetical protein